MAPDVTLPLILAVSALAADIAYPAYLVYRGRYFAAFVFAAAMIVLGTAGFYTTIVEPVKIGYHTVIVNETNKTIINNTIVYSTLPLIDYNLTGGALLNYVSSVYIATVIVSIVWMIYSIAMILVRYIESLV